MPDAMPLHIDRRPAALYFPMITGLLLLLSLIAFSDNLFTNVGQPSNSDPQMVIHGLFAAAWVALFAAQAWLINLRRISAHRRVGRIGFVAGVGMALSTVYLFYSKFRGFAAMDGEVLANRLLLPVFVVCFVLAWRRRNRADWHKRLLLVGTMALLEPVLARIYDPLFGWLLPVRMDPALDMALFLTYLFGTWAVLLGSLWLYDRAVLGRIHPVTWSASGAIVALNAAAHLA